MKTLFLVLLLAFATIPALAQQPLRYTIWADGLVNAQLTKSSFYFFGAGIRGEVSKPIRNSRNALFGQVGYGHFFQKPTSAFVANLGLINVGYRYQSRRAFRASVGVGAQYWTERMRVQFSDYAVDETFTNLMPGATLGLGVRLGAHYAVGLDYRGMVQLRDGQAALRNNLALSVGYTF